MVERKKERNLLHFEEKLFAAYINIQDRSIILKYNRLKLPKNKSCKYI